MKNFRIIIAVLLVIAVSAACFAACKKKEVSEAVVTVAVTDENGEPVTDENGETLTEIVSTVAEDGSDAVSVSVEGGDASPSVSISQSSGSQTTSSTQTTKQSGNTTAASTTKGKEAVTKPKAPKTPSSFKATEVTMDSIKLTWSKVDCKGYHIYLFEETDTKNPKQQDTTTKTSYTFKKLTSNTTYYFLLIPYNENAAGESTNNPQVQTKATTKVNDTSRKRKITVKLPTDGNAKDTLTIAIAADGADTATVVKTAEVTCSGNTFTYTTDKKYAGNITVVCKLTNHDYQDQLTSDKDEFAFDLTYRGIDTDTGEEAN